MLAGKVGIVTGGGSGIGREAALLMAGEGAKVVVSDVVDDHGAETVAMIEAAGGTASFMHADVADPAHADALVKFAVDTYGALHLAVNNAGIGGPAGLTGEYPIDGWQKVIDINLSGVFYGMRAQLPAMVAAGGGSIVNISSILGFVGFAMSSAYVAAKHGVVGLTQNAALEYATQGVRVNSVHPGFIETPLVSSAGIQKGDDTYNFIASKHAMGRFGTPQEVAEVIVWLLTDKASFVTGSQYVVDGGYLAQ
ncbi:MAG: SDR family oxidoreductase [Coriobacteriia bacterium]|nr:SDR family oxidoreductase [Coriobacteriia bacterium]